MTRAPDGDRAEGNREVAAAEGSADAAEKVRKPSRYLAARMIGAARLDGAVLRAVRDDRHATFQALQVVLLAALSAAMSGVLPGDDPRLALAGAAVAWLTWVFVAHQTARRALGLGDDSTDWNQLLRTAGMALTPAILLLFSSIPFAGVILFGVSVAWTVVAMAGAVRHTYDGGTWAKAVQASVAGWLAAGIVYEAIILIDRQIRGS